VQLQSWESACSYVDERAQVPQQLYVLKEKATWLGVNLGPKEGEKRPRKTTI